MNDKDEETLLELGASHSDSGENKDAIEIYSKVLEVNPNNAEAYRGLSISYYNIRNFEKALSSIETGIKLEPNNARMYTWRGTMYAWTYIFPLALANMNKAIELEPENAQYYKNRAFVKGGMKDKDGRNEDLKKAKELEGNK